MTQSQKHIDHDRLYTDVQYRYEYVSEFIGFGKRDQDLIHKSATVVAGLVPTIVNGVYEKLFNYDITWSHFAQDQDGLIIKDEMSKDASNVTMDSEVVTFRKTMLTKYLKKLVTSDWNLSYLKYLDWVGHMHTTTPMKKSSIDVEYIHCNALFGYLSEMVVDALQKSTEWDDSTRDGIVRAYVKFFWIQNDMFSKYYVKDRVLSDKEKAAVVAEKEAQEDEIRRELRSESFRNAAVGTAAGFALGAVFYKCFSR
ncbi:hypothetical protein LPJ59_000805 [Coemansia sp. RSA 2399]|nr:hypothetical protein LPJ59_000805 [Coemansia sp. RSA 2399]KAJ1907250.1 hypothetical protein LPJ81_000878 [Coemansia sp. IMI 209127]